MHALLLSSGDPRRMANGQSPSTILPCLTSIFIHSLIHPNKYAYYHVVSAAEYVQGEWKIFMRGLNSYRHHIIESFHRCILMILLSYYSRRPSLTRNSLHQSGSRSHWPTGTAAGDGWRWMVGPRRRPSPTKPVAFASGGWPPWRCKPCATCAWPATSADAPPPGRGCLWCALCCR